MGNCAVCGQPTSYLGDDEWVHLEWGDRPNQKNLKQDTEADADHAAYVDTPDYDDYPGKHDD
jgi:hypothetical protein